MNATENERLLKSGESSRPDTDAILAGLKDFQRDTVEHVFRRMYLDQDYVRRFLVADEVGLGKTLVARGVIAKAIDHLWTRTERIDIIYVCSNSDIARQNIRRLNVTTREDVSHASRITLLPLNLLQMDSRLNFVSFTPGTSFDLRSSGGIAQERALLYRLLKDGWSIESTNGSRPFEGTASREGFSYWIDEVQCRWNRGDIHEGIASAFATAVENRPDLRETYDGLLENMPPRRKIPLPLRTQCLQWIGELRRLLAKTCLDWLEPDLIILDEFQRFKTLLQGDSEEASEAAQLAEHLFSFQQREDDPETAARVLLLSATPYKMYTQSRESEHDDHYADFQKTLEFLMPDSSRQAEFQSRLTEYREELFRLEERGVEGLSRVKQTLESSLRKVMVRTERLALKADRNGMLIEVPSKHVTLSPADLRDYLGLQHLARALNHSDLLEYWKSAPYLLNFMENYDFKRKFRESTDQGSSPEVLRAVRSLGSGLIEREAIEQYQKLDPANARLRSLHEDTIAREAWRLLWIPASLPYYEGSGPFVSEELRSFTKRLVFSNWRVVPKAIATVLSYEAERRMTQRFSKRAQNTTESRKRRRALLRFTFSKERPTGMPVLAMTYPCRVFADRCDPLRLRAQLHSAGQRSTQGAILRVAQAELEMLLDSLVLRHASTDDKDDERWYWAAPFLLDIEHDHDSAQAWLENGNLAATWSDGRGTDDDESAAGWTGHVELVQSLLRGELELGLPPDDLSEVLATMAVAGPGVVSLRSLERVLPQRNDGDRADIRSSAGPLAHSFLHLFNLPEVMYLLRERDNAVPYWRSVLDYCVAGNLQAVMDEFAHVLVESLGLYDSKRSEMAERLSEAMSQSVTLRTSTAKADIITTTRQQVHIRQEDAVRFRTRFAMRFGDQEPEEGSEQTRADHVRSAFNSPFWPFVLATTSVGQEGLDFHPYCHAVVHWNLPSNPVDLEQREGRVHRYKGHALRKNIAATFADAPIAETTDPWEAMFRAAKQSRPSDENDLFPFWIAATGPAKIERHVPALPHSREQVQKANLCRSLVLYRMVFGQNRQEDLVDYLANQLPPEQLETLAEHCRIDLSPGPAPQPPAITQDR